MADFVIRPAIDTDFDNATFHSGSTPLTATGLINDTAYEAFVLSAASASFTPIASGGGGTEPVGSYNVAYGGYVVDIAPGSGNASGTRTMADIPCGGAAAGRRLVAFIACRGTAAKPSLGTVTIGGVAATLITRTSPDAGINCTLEAWEAIVPTGTTATVTAANTGTISFNLMVCSLVAVYDGTVDASAQNETSGDQSDVNVNTTDGGHLLVGCMSYNATNGATITGDATPALDEDLDTNDRFLTSVQPVPTGQSPRIVNVQASPSTQIATIALAVSST